MIDTDNAKSKQEFKKLTPDSKPRSFRSVKDPCLPPAIVEDTSDDSFLYGDTTVKWLCMNLHFFRSLVSAMNIILGHYNLIILLELMV